MKEILETIITTLVSDKDSVSIKQIDGEQSVIFEVKVAEADMGKVIGKQGNAIYNLSTVATIIGDNTNPVSTIVPEIQGANNAVNTTNNHVFPVKML